MDILCTDSLDGLDITHRYYYTQKIENGTHDVDHMHECYTVDIMSYFLFN